MSEDEKIAKARVGGGSTLSRIWLVPILAALIGLWMTYAHWSSQGPLIEIAFVSGEGIEAGKTKVRRKNVDIGEVLDLTLSEDTENVVLSVRIHKDAESLLHDDSKFWVVRPRIGRGGISGLNTLLSGAYIALSPGTSGEMAFDFEGLEVPPVTPIGTPGLHVTLDTQANRSLSEGDPVLFRGTEVGKIEFVHSNISERRTYFNAFIASPYDQLITTNTRFWFSSGVSANLSADGIRIEMTSLSAVVSGGVSFDVPQGQEAGERIAERAFFTIYPRESAIHEQQYEHTLTYVILLEDSIRGLRPGAPVEYRGVKVGQVIRTDTNYDEVENLLEPGSRIPVLIELVPARLGYDDSENALSEAHDRVIELVANGLHAGLSPGNILTGRKFVEFQYREPSPGEVQRFAGHTVIPSIEGRLGQLMSSAADVLDTIRRLPLQELAGSANNTLDQITSTLAAFEDTSIELEEILAHPDREDLVGSLNSALVSFQQLAVGFSEGSATNQELQQSLRSLDRSLRELEPVLRNLRRSPNSLIFGGSDNDDVEPQKDRSEGKRE